MTRLPRNSRLGRPPKQEARNTREAILDSALELFAARGFAGTSLRQIARAVDISESAVYAHFASKKAIYDELFGQIGPPATFVVDFLRERQNTIADADPATVVRALVKEIMTVWSQQRARLFISFFMREGVLATADGRGSIQVAIALAQRELGHVFNLWIDRGSMQASASPEHLTWELIAPIITIRFLYLHNDTTEEQRQEGVALAERHVEYFLASVLPS